MLWLCFLRCLHSVVAGFEKFLMQGFPAHRLCLDGLSDPVYPARFWWLTVCFSSWHIVHVRPSAALLEIPCTCGCLQQHFVQFSRLAIYQIKTYHTMQFREWQVVDMHKLNNKTTPSKAKIKILLNCYSVNCFTKLVITLGSCGCRALGEKGLEANCLGLISKLK